MKIGVIRYPGSNCFNDTINYFGINNCIEIWHKIDIIPDIDLLIIPGGFAFGDRYYKNATDNDYEYSPGKMAVESPVTKVIMDAYKKNIPILGICNGFQILIHLGLLPGELIENNSKQFISKLVHLNYKFNQPDLKLEGVTQMYIANYYGNYKNLNLHKDDVFLEYKSLNGEYQSNVAGIMNKKKTIFGMMPHPERNSSFKEILYKILFYNKNSINSKINNLLNSEHISYKSTKKFLRDLYCSGVHVIQGPGENAGIVDIGNDYCLSIRIESHNHPTYKNPFEGAATGVGGIIRDIICMGTKPIALLDFLRFGTDNYSEQLLNGAIEGISYYGNTIGIPNVGGSLYRSEIYNKNPLVNVACIGIVKKDNIIYGNALNEGSILILCGAKTGNEGVDSAIMASQQSNDKNEKNIQKADAYLENLLLDAFMEISDKKLAEGCQDLGAGGILCASTEVIKRGREKTGKKLGCEIYLENISLKTSLDPYSILASETQERMLLVSSKENSEEIYNILNKWDLEFNIIGKVTTSDKYKVLKYDSIVYSEYMDNFKEKDNDLEKKYNNKIYSVEKIKDITKWNVYDHSIGSRTIKGPDKPGQYSILDLPEVGKKLVVTWSNNVKNCYKKITDLNAKPLGIVNCLNFGDPNTCIGDFETYVDNMNKHCIEYDIPILGGNVSMYNSFNNIDIPPSVVIVMIGLL